jgi:zinc protease
MEEDLMDLAFERSTYKHTTMGFLEDIEAMPEKYDYSLEFFDRHYVPRKAVIFVVGDFDAERVMKLIREHYAGWTRPGRDVSIPEEPEQMEQRRTHIEWDNEVLPQMLLGYKAPAYSATDRDFAALTVLGELLFGETSDLYRELVLDEQVVEELDFWDWPHRDPALWITHVTFKKRDFDGVLARIDEAIDTVAGGGTDPERLEAVKSHYRYSFVLGLETPRSVANQLSFYATLDGDPATADRFLTTVGEVTAEDVARVAREYLVAEKRTIVTLAHGAGEGE